MHLQRQGWAAARRRVATALARAHWADHDDRSVAESDTRLSRRASVLFIVAVSVAMWIAILLGVLQFVR
jgi:hypothetical protein